MVRFRQSRLPHVRVGACARVGCGQGSGGRSGPGVRKSRAGVNSFSGARILETASFRYYY